MPLREPFKRLAEEAYDQRAGEMGQEIEQIMRQMKADGIQAAGEAYDTLTGSEHGSYIQRIRDGYRSDLARRLTEVQVPTSASPPNIHGAVWPAIDYLMEHTYNGQAEIGELVNAVMSRLGTASGKHRGGIRGAIGRFAGQHGYDIRGEGDQRIVYKLQQAP